MKNRKYWKRRLGNMFEYRSGYWQHLNLRRIRGMDDEGLSFVLDHVRAVNMLDLDHTKISNRGIAMLPQLEYVKELRLKEVIGVDDTCVKDLVGINELEFLHLEDSSITIDGLLTFYVPGLKELMFSSPETASLAEKMNQLRGQLPGCSFTVNAKPWKFDN